MDASRKNPCTPARADAASVCGNELRGVAGGVQDLLRCPVCHARLLRGDGELVCASAACETRYPVVGNVPVLINDGQSLFSREDFIGHRNTAFDLSRSRFKQWVDKVLPSLGRNLKAKHNYRLLAGLLLARSPEPVVLVVGGRVLGEGMEALVSRRGIRLVETDVALGPRHRPYVMRATFRSVTIASTGWLYRPCCNMCPTRSDVCRKSSGF